MPLFVYTAKSFEGEEKKGSLEAGNEAELARALKEEGLVLIFAREKEAKKRKLSFALFGVSLTEKLMFIRNLKVMISAGIALPRSLEILSTQTKSKLLTKTLLEIKGEIVKGKNFSEALSEHPKVFSDLFASMIRVGEASGTMEDVLDLLAKQLYSQHELKSKIQGALIYPSVIILAMVGIGAAMLLMVVPKIAETFRELEVDLPATTRLVIWLGETIVGYWYIVLGVLLFLPFLLWQFAKTEPGKKTMSYLSLKIPIISSVTKKANGARMVRTLSSLIGAGVPLTESLEIISASIGNFYYRESIATAAQGVRHGRKLSESLEDYSKIYSPMVLQMIAVGEETGQTSDILDKLAAFYEEEVANITKNLASVIEPIIMLVIGGVVGFFAVSMVQPMYSMLGAIN